MPYRRSRALALRRRVPRRRTVWATYRSTIGFSLTSGTILNVNILSGLQVAGAGILGGTVIRTHVAMNVRSLTADTGPALLWGLIVADPSTSIPAIGTDDYADWVMDRVLTPGTSEAAVLDPAAAPTGTIWGREYDVRARRKLRELNDQYWWTVKNIGTQTVTMTVLIRTLVALP